MHLDIIWVTACFLSFPLISSQETKPLYVMMAPQILKVGAATNVFVEIQDNPKESEIIEVSIRVLNFPAKDTELHTATVKLTLENNFQSTAKIEIPYRENIFNADSREKQYVYLQAKFRSKSLLQHSLETIILVTFQSGYIFVQTDKTIYTPDSTVKYRIFSLDTNLKPVKNQVITEIVTPDGIVMPKDTLHIPANGLVTEGHKLDSPVSNGIWNITAKVKNSPNTHYTAQFEVKEYVLPSFEVELHPERPFFYVNDKELTVKVQAKYLFGKKVNGNAVAVFGIVENQKKISLPASLQRVPIQNGEGTVKLNMSVINNLNTADLNDKIIFLTVSVRSESGEIVEAQRGGIHIASSPYSIHFIRTPKYFKPGMPFDFTVLVTNPDKTPVKNLGLLLVGTTDSNRNHQNSVSTNNDGMAKFSINTGKQYSSLKIKVQTKDSKLRPDRQGMKEMEAFRYNPKDGSKNYLHISITNSVLEVGNMAQFRLHLGDTHNVPNQDFTYMILSRGQILSVDRYKRSDNSQIALDIQVTKDMLPSFRFVAYYHVGSSEVVSDSVLVDVKDTCMGSLQVETENVPYSPSAPITMKITGDQGANVGLVAVDKAIYVLNNRNRLTQAKMWDYVDKNDIGCTAGSGNDSMGVFHDAGLVFQSNYAGGTLNRREFSCPSVLLRRRRDVNLLQLKNTLVGKFNGNLKKCCMDGMVKNLLDYSCQRRSEYIMDGEECRKAFVECCTEMIRMEEKAIEEELILARSSDDDLIDESLENVIARTWFPESWLWDTVVLPNCDSKQSCETTSSEVTRRLPASITTWVITAISMSKDDGICVGDSKEVAVKKNFFIDLKLPYSVVVKEQIQIKAIIHNSLQLFEDENNKVFVELLATDGICSEASNKKKHRKTIGMQSKSSYTVTFPIIPLKTGEFDITVRAAHLSRGMVDAVKKQLKVVTNGVLTKVNELTYVLDPARAGGNQKIQMQRPVLNDQMPGTDAKTHVFLRGSPLDQLTEQAIYGQDLGRFIQKPYGCGEQNMMRLALPVIATLYLDKTNRWNDVGVDKRTDALQHISTGVMTQMNYLYKEDSSFTVFKDSPGSVWLTAYVVKIFSIASNLIPMNKNVICDAMKWLNSQQLTNGAFPKDRYKELFTTAYVLMALQEGREVCSEKLGDLEHNMKRSIEYIQGHISSETDPLSVAIALYTLKNAEKLNEDQRTKSFQEFLIHDSSGSYWNVLEDLSKLQATGYALLTLIKIKDFVIAEPVVRWLQQQQKLMGNYGSSQTTVVVYQALAKYYEEVEQPKYPDLAVTLSLSKRNKPTEMLFTKGSERLRHSQNFNANDNLTVIAKGTGKGSISFMTLYYAKPEKKNTKCNFELNVNFEKEPKGTESYKLTIEIRFLLTDRNAGMTILDISMMTGFEPDQADLNKLVNGVDRFIHKYEINKELSEQGSLIIYLDTVSNKNKERIVFRMKKMFNVDFLQPAVVSVYEYYSSEKPCMAFYDPEREKGLLDTLCHNEVCLCAEENCPKLDGKHTSEERNKTACDVKTDYVYVAVLEKINTADKRDIYTFNIKQVLKEGTEGYIENQKRDFSAHINCRSKMKLKEGSQYLIMGPVPTSLQQSYVYSLTAQTWLENWSSIEDSQGQEILLNYEITNCL